MAAVDLKKISEVVDISSWIDFRTERPRNDAACFVWHRERGPKGWIDSGVVPAIFMGHDPNDAYFKADGAHYTQPDDGCLLWIGAEIPEDPTLEQVEGAIR